MINRLAILIILAIVGAFAPIFLVVGLVYWIIVGRLALVETIDKIGNWVAKNV